MKKVKRPMPPGPRPRIGRKAVSKSSLAKPSVVDPLLAEVSRTVPEETPACTPHFNSTDAAFKSCSKPDIASNRLMTNPDSLSGLGDGINVEDCFHADPSEKPISPEVHACGLQVLETNRMVVDDAIGLQIDVGIEDSEARISRHEEVACGISACVQIGGSNMNALTSLEDTVHVKSDSFEMENKVTTMAESVLDDDRPSSIEKVDSVPRISKVTTDSLVATECGADRKEDEEEVKKSTSGPPSENADTENRAVLLAVEETLDRKIETDIFIGELDGNIREDNVRKAFQYIGEIVELRLVKENFSGKSKAFALLRFSSAAEARKVLEKCPTVEVSGRQCRISSVESNTLFLGNINKKWKSEDVIAAIKWIGIEKFDKVSIVIDPNNLDLNQGAFVKLTTYEDAEIAYEKIEETTSGELQYATVIWPESLGNPAHPFSGKIRKNKRKALSESSSRSNPVEGKPDQSRNKESSSRSDFKRGKHIKVSPYTADRRRDQSLCRHPPLALHRGTSNLNIPLYETYRRRLFPACLYVPLNLHPREFYMDHGVYRPWVPPITFTDASHFRPFLHSAGVASFPFSWEQGYRTVSPANNIQRGYPSRGSRSQYYILKL